MIGLVSNTMPGITSRGRPWENTPKKTNTPANPVPPLMTDATNASTTQQNTAKLSSTRFGTIQISAENPAAIETTSPTMNVAAARQIDWKVGPHRYPLIADRG